MQGSLRPDSTQQQQQQQQQLEQPGGSSSTGASAQLSPLQGPTKEMETRAHLQSEAVCIDLTRHWSLGFGKTHKS
jgi:hypothetical protein